MLWKLQSALIAFFTANAIASYSGFSYDASAPFSSQFAAAKQLQGTNGMFSSARLYTTIVRESD